MIEAELRYYIQPLFNFVGETTYFKFFTPNKITALAFISGVFSGCAIAGNYLYLALMLLLFSGLCDVMDGTIARLTNNTQKVGAYIDLISDRMVEAAVILGFTILMPENYFAFILFFVAVLFHFTTFLATSVLYDNQSEKSIYYDHSLVERAEAFLVFSLMLLFPIYSFSLLMIFNTIVFFDGLARFYRIISLSK
ncbi:MAG: CDP-alcohol phosphatidyltransferase family protein [Candidatus Babeliales bacterium]